MIVGNVRKRKTAYAAIGPFLLAAAAAVVAYALASFGLEQKDSPSAGHVGSKRCRLCHNSPSRGKIYDVWSKNKHAGAYQTLLTPEAKNVGKKLGIHEPHKSGECLRCHATAYGLGKKPVTKKIEVEEGVGCESCHGPGEDYAKISVMQDLQKAVAAGLVHPAKNVCTNCHNPESPTWNPERYTDRKGNKTGFDFEVLWKMIEHSMPRK